MGFTEPHRSPGALGEGVVLTREDANHGRTDVAETGDADGSVLDHGRAKLARKGCDVLVVNEVGADKTFGADDNTVTILRRGTDEGVEVGPASKAAVSTAVWDVVADLL